MVGNRSQETLMMCFSLGDIFEDIWEEPGNVSGFVHVFDQCTKTHQPQCITWLGHWWWIGIGFQFCLGFQAVWSWPCFTYPTTPSIPFTLLNRGLPAKFRPLSKPCSASPSPLRVLWRSHLQWLRQSSSQTAAKDKTVANAYFWLFPIFPNHISGTLRSDVPLVCIEILAVLSQIFTVYWSFQIGKVPVFVEVAI